MKLALEAEQSLGSQYNHHTSFYQYAFKSEYLTLSYSYIIIIGYNTDCLSFTKVPNMTTLPNISLQAASVLPSLRASMHSSDLAVNFHLIKPCNMKCKFCFATYDDISNTESKSFYSFENHAKIIQEVAMLPRVSKITFVGGEPTLVPWLPELVKLAHDEGLTTMMVTNGAILKNAPDYLEKFDGTLEWIGLSVDSIISETNSRAGRVERKNSGAFGLDDYLAIHELIDCAGIRFKLNTVVHSGNHTEDMGVLIEQTLPERWKIFQALPVKGQNDRHIANYVVTKAQFEAYVERHKYCKSITRVVPENNDAMTSSYLMIDPLGRFFENTEGTHKYSRQITEVGASSAFREIRFSEKKFNARDGRWNWK